MPSTPSGDLLGTVKNGKIALNIADEANSKNYQKETVLKMINDSNKD